MNTRVLLLLPVTLAALVGCRPQTELPRTDPSTWANGGWQGLRWGMGLGDVELLLRAADGDLARLRADRLPEMHPESSCADCQWALLPGALTLARRSCEVRIGFYRGSLSRVSIVAKFPGPAVTKNEEYVQKEMSAWRDNVISLLTEKYGTPSKISPNPEWWSAEWNLGATKLTVDAIDDFVTETGERVAVIRYVDPAREALSQGLDPADKSKL